MGTDIPLKLQWQGGTLYSSPFPESLLESELASSIYEMYGPEATSCSGELSRGGKEGVGDGDSEEYARLNEYSDLVDGRGEECPRNVA